MQDNSVGHSDYRTPAKHEFQSSVIGREMGAAPYVARQLGWEYRRHIFYDLTAGDGIAYRAEGRWDEACSPGIFARHACYRPSASLNLPDSIEVYLYERAPATYEMLCTKLKSELPKLGYEFFSADGLRECWVFTPAPKSQPALFPDVARLPVGTTLLAVNNDSREIDFSQYGKGDWLFINNDPNKISDWAYKYESILTAIQQGAVVQVFNTMGCNVGGLKRLPWGKGRDQWLGYMQGVEALIQAGHPTLDLVLLSVERDASQWAYLVTTPKKWVPEIVQQAVKIFSRHKLELRTFSYFNDRRGYESAKSVLIRTAKELA